MFPDIEKALVAGLRANVAARAATRVPDDVHHLAEFVRVASVGGPDDGVTVRAVVDFEAMAPTYGAAKGLAARVEAYVGSLTASRPGGVLVDSTARLSGPTYIRWSPTVERLILTYQVSFRRV